MLKEIFNIIFIERPDFFINLAIEHLIICITSIIIATLIGLIIGVLISEYKKSSSYVLNIINFLYTIPSISMLGFLIGFSGIGKTTAIIALTIYALLPMVRSTYTGFTNIPDDLIETAVSIGSTKRQILFNIKIPLAMPIIISGIRNMSVMTIALAGIASFVGAGGLGVAVYRGITTNNKIMIISGSLLIAVIAISVDFVFSLIESFVSYKKVVKKSKKISAVISIILLLIIPINMFLLNRNKDTINIATKPMTEQYILGEILSQLIKKETNLKVNVTYDVAGGASNIHPAILKKQFDIYPEYTGTIYNAILKKDDIYTNNKLNFIEDEYDKLGLTLKGFYGFNNTYSIAIRKEIAEKYNLKTFSDLAKVSDQLIFGAEYDFFEREDGYKEISKIYGFNFKEIKDLDISIKYEAIEQNKIDVMSVFTTDARLNQSNLKILEDDKQFYPSYNCVNVVRKEILEKYPELNKVFNMITNLINDETMSKLNAKVEIEKIDPKVVAKEFLQEKFLK